MRFEEVSYRVDDRPVTLAFDAGMTVVGLTEGSRQEWAERALGVLLGTRAGDDVTLVFVDNAGHRLRLERDRQGAATVSDVANGEEVGYAAFHLSLDGRFDWFASIGIDTDSARALVLLDPSTFELEEDFDPLQLEAELARARHVLSRAEDEYQAVIARHRQAQDLHSRAEAAHAAIGAGEEWRRATVALADARRAFGERARLDPDTVRRALGLPTEVPAGLDVLHANYLSAARRRSELTARLDKASAPPLPAPSAPWVLRLARHAHPELWERAERVQAAKAQMTALSMGLGGTGRQQEIARELEVAHRAVEDAERELAAVKVPALAIAARRRLARAREHEQAMLARSGFASWLSIQMRRLDVLFERDALEALQLAELESQVAEADWRELAGEADAEAALAAREEIEGHAAAMAVAERIVTTAEALRRQLADDVEPDYAEARAALLDACRAFDVDPEHAAAQVSAKVAEARHARLQQALEDAEAACHDAETRLESHLAGLGLLGGDGASILLDERARLLEEARRAEHGLPDVGRLREGREELQQRVAALEAACDAGYKLVSYDEAETVLLGRIGRSRRAGPWAEPVPVVVIDAFAGFARHDKRALLDLLGRLSEATQIVYLTADHETLEWASTKAGTGVATVLQGDTRSSEVA